MSFGSSTDAPRPMFVASTRPTAGLLARGSAPRPAFPAARAPPVAYPDKTSHSQLRGQLRTWPALARKTSPHSLFALKARDRRSVVIDFAGPPCQSGGPACASDSKRDVERAKAHFGHWRGPFGQKPLWRKRD